jgi:hypothetical protein
VREQALAARPAALRAGAVLLAVAALTLAGWLGLRWTDGPERAAVAASPAAATADARAPEPTPDPAPVDAPDPADRAEAPTSAAGWQEIVTELYERRAAAFRAADAEALGGVYTADSALRKADEEHARSLAEAGEALRGFEPVVVAVTAVDDEPGEPGRVRVHLVDRWADYEVVAAGEESGPGIRTVTGRGEASVRLTVVRTPEGWRIETAERLG